MLRKSCFKWVVVGVMSFLLSTPSAPAGLTNGEFTYDLSGWTVEAGVDWYEYAPYAESAVFSPDDDEIFLHSTLSQVFTLDAGSTTLSFDVVMPGVFGETDKFTASLSNPTSNLPLVSITGETYFYYLDSAGNFDHSLVTVVGKTVSLNVSTWAGEQVKLAFDLEHNYDDLQQTYVSLDNVKVTGATIIIPAPGALLLGGIGVGIIGFLRRSKLVKIF